MNKFLQFIRKWRERRRRKLEKEYRDVEMTITQCERENDEVRDRLKMGAAGAASYVYTTEGNIARIIDLSSRRDQIARKLKYL